MFVFEVSECVIVFPSFFFIFRAHQINNTRQVYKADRLRMPVVQSPIIAFLFVSEYEFALIFVMSFNRKAPEKDLPISTKCFGSSSYRLNMFIKQTNKQRESMSKNVHGKTQDNNTYSKKYILPGLL